MDELTNEEKIDRIGNFVMGLAQSVENLSNLFHMALLENGQAKAEQCSNCNTQVVFPQLKQFLAFPVCPNAEKDEKCAEGFSHVENPFTNDEEE